MKRAILIAAIISSIGTLLSIAAWYTDYDELGYSLSRAFKSVLQWPLVGMSLTLTTISLLVPFAAHFFRRTSDPGVSLAVYAFGYLWLGLFVFHPGLRALGVTSEKVGFAAWFCVCAFQYAAAKVVLKAITSEASRDAA